MIFVTVGTQLPFERLIIAIDEWAARNPARDVFAQVGPCQYQPKNITYKKFISPLEFEYYTDKCEFVVSHAGMGTIITSLSKSKPIIIVPRDAKLGEHRNQHQFSTCDRFKNLRGCYTSEDEKELTKLLDKWNLSNKQEFHKMSNNKLLSEKLFSEVFKMLYF